MSNANMPAYPHRDNCGDAYGGLTKRELFAKDIYCAILSRNPDAGCVIAVEHADALLAELAREAM